MFEGLTIIDITKLVFFWSSPLLFILGLLILLSSSERFSKLEAKLGREIGGIRKRILPILERNILGFQNWLLKKRTIVGLLCVICSIIFFFLLKK